MIALSEGVVVTKGASSVTVSTGHRSVMFEGAIWTWVPTLVEVEIVGISTRGTLVGVWSVTGQTVTVTEFTMLSLRVSIVSIWTWVDTFSVV